MGNDYPDCVFAKQEDAELYVAKKKTEEMNNGLPRPRIYWRSYEFEVQ
jgi:hypothetical protein